VKLLPHLAILLGTLAEAGGFAEMDAFGRLVVGATKLPLPGDPVSWLRLVADGHIAGEHGKLIMTEAGRVATAFLAEGQVRRAAG